MTFDGQLSPDSFERLLFPRRNREPDGDSEILILQGHLSGGENALKMKKDGDDLFGYNSQIKAASLSQ